MNEEVLLDLFNRAVSLGYNQTVEDFTELIKTNPDVLRDNYDYVVGQGYERSLEDFEILIGAKQPVKKKEEDENIRPISELFSEDSTEQFSELEGSEVPSFFPRRKEIRPEYGVTAEEISRDEEVIVPELNYRFGNDGFFFEESGTGFDQMIVTAANGKTETIGLDAFTDKGNRKQRNKLNKFLQENKQESIQLQKLENKYEEDKIIFNTEKEAVDLINKINKESNDFENEIKALISAKNKLEVQRQAVLNMQPGEERTKLVKEINQKQKEIFEATKKLPEKQAELQEKSDRINYAYGEYVTAQKKAGSQFAKLTEDFFGYGPGSILAGAADIFIDFQTGGMVATSPEMKKLKDQRIKKVKRNLLPKLENLFIDISGGKNVSDMYRAATDENFWSSSFSGLFRSLPAFIATRGRGGKGVTSRYGLKEITKRQAQNAVRFGRLFSMVDSQYEKEMREMDLTEDEKAYFKLPLAFTAAVLENLGFRNLMTNSGIVRKVLSNVLKKVPVNPTAATLRNAIRNEVKNPAVRGLLTIAGGTVAEAETGAFQQIADITGKMAFNEIKGKQLFQTPESFMDGLKEVLYASAQEAVGGFVLSTPGAIADAQAKKDYSIVDQALFDIFLQIRNDGVTKKAFTEQLKLKVLKGEITQEQMDEQLKNYETAGGIANKIPTDISPEKQRSMFGLLANLQEKQQQLEGKDKILQIPIKEEIEEIESNIALILAQKEAQSKEEKIEDFQQEEGETPGDLKTKEEKEQASEIDAFFGDEVEETTETVEDNLSINRSKVTKEKSTKELDNENRIIKFAKFGAKAVKKLFPKLRIVLHETTEEYGKFADVNTAGEFIENDQVIHIDLQRAKGTTVAHEIFHAVFLNKIKTDVEAMKVAEKMMQSVRKTLSPNSKLGKRIDKYAKKYADKPDLQNEERLAELTGILSSEYRNLTKPQKNIIKKFISDIAKYLGIEINIEEFTKTDEDVIDLLNTLSRKVRTGEEIVEADIEVLDNIDDGTNPIGSPTEIRVPPRKRGQRINFKESYPLSLITPDKQVDILPLIDNISKQKQKVWFWIADQLGDGEYNGVTLDAGPSFPFGNVKVNENAIWATNMAEGAIKNKLEEADYIFIISGSPQESKLFNKKVYDVFTQNLGDYNTFKQQALDTKPIKAITEVLEAHDSWESLKNDSSTDKAAQPKKGIKAKIGTGRKKFLKALIRTGQTPNTSFHKLIQSLGGYINVEDLRDGFFKENNFEQNDIMLVLKPTGYSLDSNHSTYDKEILGEVVGVPNEKINALEVMPQELVDKYEGKPRNLASSGIAPFGAGVREVRTPGRRRGQRTIENIVQQFNISERGFTPPGANISQLRKAVEGLEGFEVKRSRANTLYLEKNGVFYRPPSGRGPAGPGRRRGQRAPEEYIREARDAGFKDTVIVDYLSRVRKLSMKVIKEAMEIDSEILGTLPESFKNIAGGAKAGVKLFKKVERYMKAENTRNKKRKNPLTESQILEKGIEYMKKQVEYKNEADTYKVAGETRPRKGVSTQQLLMEIDLQKTLGIRPTQDLALKIREAKRIVRERIKGIRDVQKIKTELKNFLRRTLPKDVLTSAETQKLIRMVERVTPDFMKSTKSQGAKIDNLVNEIIEFAAKKNNKRLLNEINNILYKKKYQKRDNNLLKARTIDNETRKRINRIKELIPSSDFSPEQISDIGRQLRDKFNSLSLEQNPTDEQIDEMADLQIAIGYISAMTQEDTSSTKTQALDSVYEGLLSLVERGKSTFREQMKAQSEEYKKQMLSVYYDITGVKLDPNDPDLDQKLKDGQNLNFSERDRKRASKRVKDVFLRFIRNTGLLNPRTALALSGLVERISVLPGEMLGGISQELITNRVNEGTRNYKQRKLIFDFVIKEKLREYYGPKWEKKSRQNRKLSYEIAPNTEENRKKYGVYRELSQNQMYYLYNQYKDPLSHPAFRNMFGDNYQEVMENIEKNLLPEVKAFADWQVNEFFPDLYDHYNKTYKELYRTDMPRHTKYAGRIYRLNQEYVPLDLLGGTTTFGTNVSAASTLLRENSATQIEAMDGTDALFSYVYDMEYFAAMAVPLRDINKILQNPNIKAAIQGLHGEDLYELLAGQSGIINTVASRGLRVGFGDKIMNKLNTLFVLARIGVSPLIAVKQLTSAFTYANDIGIANWLKYSVKNIVQLRKLWKEISDNSVYLQDRGSESILKNIEVYANVEGKEAKAWLPSGFAQRAGNYLERVMMYSTRFGDMGAIYLGGTANYAYYKDQFKKKNPGATEQQAINHAIKKFEKDTKETQQSYDLQDRDLFQQRGAFYRGLNMFKTTPKQYLRKELNAMRNLSLKLRKWDKTAGKGSITDNVRQLAMYHFFMPMFFQWISNGAPVDDWDEEDSSDMLRAAILGNFNGLFIIGDLLESAADYIQGKPWAKDVTSIPILKSPLNIMGLTAEYVKEKDPIKKQEKLVELGTAVLMTVGVPADQLRRYEENYPKLLESEDFATFLRRLLNYSKYQIEGPPKKEKKPKRMTKKQMKALAPDLYNELQEIQNDEDLKEIRKIKREIEKEILESLEN